MSKAALAFAVFALSAVGVGAAEQAPKSEPSKAETQAKPLKVELNAAETNAGKCRLTFVVLNRADKGLDSLKLDLAVFGKDGTIQRRLLTEMGPVRAGKTVVRTFEMEGACAGVGSVLVNEVPGCTPASYGDCLGEMSLDSHVPAIRFYK